MPADPCCVTIDHSIVSRITEGHISVLRMVMFG